jgi:hypothetical protein
VLQPLDAGSVDVGSPELSAFGLLQKVPESTSGTAAEVQHAFSIERPLFGQQPHEGTFALSAQLRVRRERIATALKGAHAIGQVQRREGGAGCGTYYPWHGHPASASEPIHRGIAHRSARPSTRSVQRVACSCSGEGRTPPDPTAAESWAPIAPLSCFFCCENRVQFGEGPRGLNWSAVGEVNMLEGSRTGRRGASCRL